MFKKLTLLFLASLIGIIAKAQNVAYHDIALSTVTNTAVGAIVRPVSGALITVCAGVHTEIPCNSPTTIFSNPAGAFQANPFNADANGNFTFYATPGNNFTVSITGTSVTGYSFPFFAPLVTFGALGNATFTSLTSSTSNPALSGSIRLAKSDTINWRNNANSADLSIVVSSGIGTTPADTITTSGNVPGIQSFFLSNSGNANATTGVYRLNSGDAIAWRNNGNSADVVLSKNASDNLVWPNGLSLAGGPALSSTNQSGTGSLCMTTNCAMTTPSLTTPTMTTPVVNGASTGTGIQGTDSKLMSSGSISGTSAPLCTDANGGATTSGCPSSGLKASVTLTGQTASIGTTTLCNTTNCPSGTYLITALVQGTVSCGTGTSTVQVILGFTDDVGAKASSTMPLANLAGNFGTTSSLSASSLGQGNFIVRTTGAQPIQYTTSYTSCSTGGPGTYNLLLVAFQLATP